MAPRFRWSLWTALVLQGLSLPALSQETMRFEPVPSESVAAMERRSSEQEARRAERRREAGQTLPEAPVAPEPPSIPELSHSGDVVRIGSDIHITEGQVVEGDVFALQGDIRVDGHVKGNVAATGGDVTLGSSARVDGDVMCIGGKLEEEPGARVGGQRVTALHGTRRGRRIDVTPGASDDWEPDWNPGGLSFAFSWLLVSALLAWVLSRFAPVRTGVALATLKAEPGLSLLLGLGLVLLLVPSVVAMALVVAILCITIIGIPLALGVMIAYAGLLVILALWGYVIGVIPVGEQASRRVGRDPARLVSAAVLGVLVVSGLRLVAELFHFVPFFGWFANLLWVIAFLGGVVATLIGAGALIRSKFGQGAGARWWPLKTSPAPASAPAAAPAEGAPPASPGEPSPAS